MFEIDGLDEMSIEARSERAFAICRLTIPCNCNQHRVSEVRSLPQLLGHDITVQLRQSNIEDDRRPCAATMGHPSTTVRGDHGTPINGTTATMGHPSIGMADHGTPINRRWDHGTPINRDAYATFIEPVTAFQARPRNTFLPTACVSSEFDGCPEMLVRPT